MNVSKYKLLKQNIIGVALFNPRVCVCLIHHVDDEAIYSAYGYRVPLGALLRRALETWRDPYALPRGPITI